MKKYQELTNLHNIFIDNITNLNEKIELQIKKIKQENNKNLIEEKIKLLQAICTDEKLDFNSIKYKYLKQKDVDKVINSSVNTISSVSTETIFNKIVIDDTIYYYEDIENGRVLDVTSNIVGKYINNEISFN